ncbi:hypothetical protein Dsin_004157 [Dipteronia sinensis]|uniref:Dirigent protein n=1 Tax=Dipteronia sinensis TaxID=43782 RepID=A0AAE0B9G6_9ROSI|nr:hypothetical protein Dsin_004157 [Dipteronia sinensis]
METSKLMISMPTKSTTSFLTFLTLMMITILSATSARILDEQPAVPSSASNPSNPVSTPVANVPQLPINPSTVAATITTSATNANNLVPDHTLTFFMHDILGGSNPSALPVTGIVNNPAVGGQVPFAKPNGAVLPSNGGAQQNNGNNIPFLTGLSGTTQNVLQNNGNNGFNFPVSSGGQLPTGSILQKLMFGTLTAIDDELTEGHELGSGFVGKAQGFYVASSVDGTSQTMAFTTMFASGHYADSLSFFGVYRMATSESQLAIMGGTGKYVNAKGFAVVKTIPGTNSNQHETDGIETLLEFTVYVTY